MENITVAGIVLGTLALRGVAVLAVIALIYAGTRVAKRRQPNGGA